MLRQRPLEAIRLIKIQFIPNIIPEYSHYYKFSEAFSCKNAPWKLIFFYIRPNQFRRMKYLNVTKISLNLTEQTKPD
ncbi:hypothetical protein CLV98_11394 [Dyadobacter jejuensis]|uniref:Uncharacterized protein n=1 Tax=Dyadobacter jejuensis TaxID=1082580 RepID=A0A316AEB7_9BACT|nr:hypothetical protein CLV98_11394 [Dyadobacter jejuensis]